MDIGTMQALFRHQHATQPPGDSLTHLDFRTESNVFSASMREVKSNGPFNVKLDTLLYASRRSRNDTLDDGYNNDGFNAILEQVGDKSPSVEMVKSLKDSLFRSDGDPLCPVFCPGVANIFHRPVVGICRGATYQAESLTIYLPGASKYFILKDREEIPLAQTFVRWVEEQGYPQKGIEALSQDLGTILNIDISKATVRDIVLELLGHPNTIVLVENPDGHIEAAPHASRPQEDSDRVLESLRDVSAHFGNIELNTLLGATDRSRNDTPDDGCNNDGFKAVLNQVGDWSSSSDMVKLLRSSLNFDDGIPFYMGSSQNVANIFHRPVAEICYNATNQVIGVAFNVPNISKRLYLIRQRLLAQPLAEWLKEFKWSQEEVNDLSQRLETILDIDASKATVRDIMLGLLRYPATITLVPDYARPPYVDITTRFNAAPHKDLKQEDSVLELLRRAEKEKKD
ncbi:MAG: hypothetical protein LBJ75_00145 [Puniceicoccales bacterium]|jgi:hypothetical protein|nr:hypothetical protein [Puniceicoccales bacterium]